jgi:hypothetical protein
LAGTNAKAEATQRAKTLAESFMVVAVDDLKQQTNNK